VTARLRAAILTAVCVIALGGALGYLVVSRNAQGEAGKDAAGGSHGVLATIGQHPRIVFRDMTPGGAYGTVAMVALDDPDGPRADTTTPCQRVYATAKSLICLSADHGFVPTYGAHILDDNLHPLQTLPFTGVPSRARLSHDGRYAASTSFINADSYTSSSFSTRTLITEVGGDPVGNLEDFKLIHGGKTIEPVDRNYWGVTFAADDDTFYATVKFSGHTWLVRGSMAKRTVTTLREDAECPSLSPDGKNIVYKQRGSLPLGKWRLVDYNLASHKVTPLAETRSVDDQAEWLDDNHVVYALPRHGTQPEVDDVWSVPTSGGGKPMVLIRDASSPAVIR
jgi:hypothetical protein